MSKKTFEIPTIEKRDFCLSDETMCAISGTFSDSGVLPNMTGTMLETINK